MTRWSSRLADPQTIRLGIYTTLWDSNMQDGEAVGGHFDAQA